jgi:hypothetical protein
MFFVREFPQLLLIFLVFILVLVMWRLLIIYETCVYNVQMGWRNDLMILCLGLITLALGIFSAILLLSISPLAKWYLLARHCMLCAIKCIYQVILL